MLIKNNFFQFDIESLAQYHMMKTTIIKHLFYSYT